jgi:hypothetical protein
MSDVLLHPTAKRSARGWHAEVIVRRPDTLERLGGYTHSEACLNRAVALQQAEEYARGWQVDFERRGNGAEIVERGAN